MEAPSRNMEDNMDMELGTHPTKLELAIRTETFSTYMTWVHLSADMYCAQSK